MVREVKKGNYILQYEEDWMIELNRETKNHPKLLELLADFPYEEVGQRVGCIAAYCNVIVDGYLSQGQLKMLCELCLRRLREKRSIIISPTESKLLH